MEIKIKVRKYFTLHNSHASLKKKNYHPPNCKLCTKTRKTKQTFQLNKYLVAATIM